MQKLSRGESAEDEIASARNHLDTLMELVETLPEPGTGEQEGAAAEIRETT